MYNSLDLTIFLVYFAVVIGLGFLAGRGKEESVGDFFRGGNQLAWYTIGFSIVAAGVSSEQFVGETGYAYKWGLPVANWEWLVYPALSILLWIFLPLYVRGRITTMPEYLERRFGGSARSLFACLSIVSYVFVNFALVFYTGGVALERMWGIDRFAAIAALALVTGAYTTYGGLRAVAWTSSFQCILLLGGGIYVFIAGMTKIGWDFNAVLGSGEQSHLVPSNDHPELPWTALVVLMVSTNVWYYATNQYINQRCLAARNEWHAKMGVLFAGILQLALPLATCFPGMIYRVINPELADLNMAYPEVVKSVVPSGLAGLVAAAIVGAIMSTVSGLMNSTSTMITLDIFGRWQGKRWTEQRLVRFGQWAGVGAVLVGALMTPLVAQWESMFRYAQDIWALMAGPIVVVFLAGALWPQAHKRGALACLCLAILTVPFGVVKGVLANKGVQILPPALDNMMVMGAAIGLVAFLWMVCLSQQWSMVLATAVAVAGSALVFAIAAISPTTVAVLLAVTMAIVVIALAVSRRAVIADMWDRSMLTGALPGGGWYANLWLWWSASMLAVATIYWYFW